MSLATLHMQLPSILIINDSMKITNKYVTLSWHSGDPRHSLILLPESQLGRGMSYG